MVLSVLVTSMMEMVILTVLTTKGFLNYVFLLYNAIYCSVLSFVTIIFSYVDLVH